MNHAEKTRKILIFSYNDEKTGGQIPLLRVAKQVDPPERSGA